MEHGGHHGYPPTSGIPHGLPPPRGPSRPQHEPPPHLYMTRVINNLAYPPPPQPPSMYGQQNFGPASANLYTVQPKKHMRATQACEQCRQRKQKCDKGNPCSFCKENNLPCQYRDKPPAKTDKNMEKVLSYMESHTEALSSLHDKIDNLGQRLQRHENAGFQAVSGTDGTQSIPGEPGDRNPDLDDHRTAPHKFILLWPSVGSLLKHANLNMSDGYVMQAEDRGVLRLYTRGEGVDEHDDTQPGGPASPARCEESGEGSSATPPDGLWGTGFPQMPSSHIWRSEPYCAGGLGPDGSLDLDVSTINTLYDSYMKNVHIMHPFLDKQRLRKLFDSFFRRYCTSHPSLHQKVAVGSRSDSQRPPKRQRLNRSSAAALPRSDYRPRRNEPTERSPGNAIVWLVLALGKICLHKEPLPQIVPDGMRNTNTVITHQLTGNSGPILISPISATINPSPMSPKSTPRTNPTPPNMDGGVRAESRSRWSSTDCSRRTAGPRNLDIVPGLAYYAKAAEILGDQGDGNDLVHAQMFLLAGLYKGQLARVKESMSWFTMAGRAIINLLDRYKLYNDNYWTAFGDIRKQHEKGQARIKDKRHSLVVLASWTCLQLETDILAELRICC